GALQETNAKSNSELPVYSSVTQENIGIVTAPSPPTGMEWMGGFARGWLRELAPLVCSEPPRWRSALGELSLSSDIEGCSLLPASSMECQRPKRTSSTLQRHREVEAGVAHDESASEARRVAWEYRRRVRTLATAIKRPWICCTNDARGTPMSQFP